MFVYFSFCRIVCKANPGAVTSFEDILFPIFQGILQQDIQGERQYRDFQQCWFNLFSLFRVYPVRISNTVFIDGKYATGNNPGALHAAVAVPVGADIVGQTCQC